jgi:hypothetical protein
MILDRYSLQTKAIFVGAILLAIVLIVFLVRHQNSRSRDVQLVANAKILATALERYYAFYRTYPEWDQASLDKVKFISDQGINKNGETIFYTNNFIWPEDADITLAIQSDDYQLDFTVHNSWPAWGVTKAKGGRCRVLKEVNFLCVDWAK